jgi:tRNA(Leu) C34 or U34 (ribose-2'-O)-methylase TrmL
MSPAPPACYLILVAVQKRLNIGMTLRAAVAFGVTQLVIVGSKKHVNTHGAHGTERFVDVHFFNRLKQAVCWLKSRGVTVCGIEITRDAERCSDHPFRGPTAFLAGAEGEGLVPAHKSACDHFVYVPHHGRGGTASLNVSVATAIVLHHYALWAGAPEAPRDEAGRDKFAMPPPADRRGGALTAHDVELQGRRAAARAAAGAAPDEDALAGAGLPGGGGVGEGGVPGADEAGAVAGDGPSAEEDVGCEEDDDGDGDDVGGGSKDDGDGDVVGAGGGSEDRGR